MLNYPGVSNKMIKVLKGRRVSFKEDVRGK